MYYDKLSDLGIKLTRRGGNEKTKCPQCSDGRKNKHDKPLSVNITTGEYNCFSAETRVITSAGVYPISDILGRSVFILDGNGDWVPTIFRKYGQDELYEIKVSRNGRTKSIYSTANHRWFVRNNVKEVTTDKLMPNQRLRSVFSKQTHDYKIIDLAVQHGFVFGDGCLENKHRNSRAYFCGTKDSSIVDYFPKENKKYIYGQKTVITGLPKHFKSVPALDLDNDYLFSWLSGYFAADGDVAENGLPVINSAKIKHLEFVRDLCNRIGIGVLGISEYERNGYNGLSKIYRITFLSSTIPSYFFLSPSHKKRFESFDKKFERTRWVVKSVEKSNRVEDVYCCEVSTTGSFVLEDNILTGNCHNCGWKGNVRSFERKRESKKYEKPDQNMVKSAVLKEKVEQWFAKRCISRGTLDKFMIFSRQEWMPQTQKEESCICFPYFRDGELVNIKFRDGAKNFKMVKDAELIFFNLQSIGEKKKVVIVEGEIDAMAVYESGISQDFSKVDPETGEVSQTDIHPYSEYAVVSVPNGASKGNQRLDYLDNCADWFIGLHEIVIATDNDEAGKLLKEELIRRLGVERCSTITYPAELCVDNKNGSKRPCKDLNEVLEHFGKEAVANIILKAELTPVDGVYYLDDLFESMLDNFKKGIQLAPTTRFKEMDNYFRWKKGDITLVTGYGNHGKSFFMLQLMLTKSIWDGWKWAIFSPENYPANDFYDDIIEMYVGKWLNAMTVEEYQEACAFIDQHIYYVYPDDGHDIHSINEKFRHLILKKGVDGVMVDPFNQLDSNQKAYQREDQYLSEILKDVKRFALLNNVVYVIVAHPKTPSYGNDKSLPVADMYDISGGSQWGNKSDQIISYYRPRFHEDKNSPEVEVYIQKLKRKRTGGKLGNFPLTLNWAKKRYMESDGSMPCDPKLANKTRLQASNNYSQQTMAEISGVWEPIKDENGTEIGF